MKYIIDTDALDLTAESAAGIVAMKDSERYANLKIINTITSDSIKQFMLGNIQSLSATDILSSAISSGVIDNKFIALAAMDSLITLINNALIFQQARIAKAGNCTISLADSRSARK